MSLEFFNYGRTSVEKGASLEVRSINTAPITNREQWMPVVIVVVGLLLRCLYLAEVSRTPEFSHPMYDPEYNAYWARGLATGDWEVPLGMTDPEIRTTPHGRPPGYPWFLAAVYTVFGVNEYAPRLVQMIFGVLNALLLYAVGKRLFGINVGFLAGLFMAVYWVFPYFEGILTYPAIAVCVLLLVMLSLLHWHDSHHWAWGLLAGVFMGGFALFRPNGLLMAPGLLLWMVWVAYRQTGTWRQVVLSLVVFLSGCVVSLAPAFVRNHIVARDTVFISSYGGINLYVGNHPTASLVEPRIPELMELAGIEHWSCFDYPAIVRGLAAREGRETMKFSEANRYFYRQALGFIRENPGLFLRNLGRKGLLFFGPYEITNDTVMEYDKRFSWVLRWLPGFSWVFGLGMFGFGMFLFKGLTTRQKAIPETWRLAMMPVVIFILYTLSVIVYFVAGRYRVPVVPIMLLFGAYGVVQLAELFRLRRWGAFVSGSLVLVLLLLAARWNSTGYVPSEGTFHLRRAMAYTARGADDEAKSAYLKALSLGAESSIIYANLGRIHFDNGEIQQGLQMYEEGLKQNSNNPVIRNNLGYELYKLGRLDEAIAHLSVAVTVNPRFALAHINLGNALADAGRPEEGLSHFREAMRLNPGDPAGPYNVARMLFAQEDYAGAVKHYEQALDIRPNHVESLNNLGYCYTVLGEDETAVGFYERAVAADPGYEIAYVNLVNALMKLGRLEQAETLLNELLAREGYTAFASYHLGRIAAAEKNWERAISFMEQAMATDADFLPALVDLGMLHLHVGNAPKALDLLEKAHALAPEDTIIEKHLSEARLALEQSNGVSDVE